MIFAVCVGVLSAIAVLIVMARIDLKKFMGYPAMTDIGVTLVLAMLLYGTYVGIVAAIIGGLFFSGLVTVIRRVYGYKRLERKGLNLVWVDYPATWIRKSRDAVQVVQSYRPSLDIPVQVDRKVATPVLVYMGILVCLVFML